MAKLPFKSTRIQLIPAIGTVELYTNSIDLTGYEVKIAKQLVPQLNAFFRGIAPQVQNDFRAVMTRIFANDLTYNSLLGYMGSDDLAGHFGFYKNEPPPIDMIITHLAMSATVKAKRFSVTKNGLHGGIELVAVQSDFQDLLSLPEAQVITKKGESLPWLEWLLIRGDEIIISDFDITFDLSLRGELASRSGKALMIKNAGASWRVPPEYSGTQDDNFITRAIGFNRAFLDQLFEAAIGKHF